jgi:hypothetical protein
LAGELDSDLSGPTETEKCGLGSPYGSGDSSWRPTRENSSGFIASDFAYGEVGQKPYIANAVGVASSNLTPTSLTELRKTNSQVSALTLQLINSKLDPLCSRPVSLKEAVERNAARNSLY